MNTLSIRCHYCGATNTAVRNGMLDGVLGKCCHAFGLWHVVKDVAAQEKRPALPAGLPSRPELSGSTEQVRLSGV